MPDSIPTHSSRPRVLLLSHSVSPVRGSECTVGWHRAIASARDFDTTVICPEEPYAAEIAAHGGETGVRWAFLGASPVERALNRLPGGTWIAYAHWQRRALALARQLDAAEPFDLVHHVNWVSFREPGYGWRLGRPFVLGPVGGTQNMPARFLLSGGPGMALREGLRSVLNRLQLMAGWRLRRAARAAAPFLAANSTVDADVRRWIGVAPVRLLETGTRAAGMPRRWADRAPGPLRLLWVGDCVNRKGAHLMSRAMQQLERERPGAVTLRVLGEGRRRAEFARLPGVTAPGLVPHPEMAAAYDAADALVFTSLRDTSGNVVLEAFGRGLPVICLDHQGVRDIVTPEAGIKVPVTTPGEAVDGLVSAIRTVAADAEAYDRMSAAAVARARHFGWDRSAEVMRRVYLAALGLGPPLDVPSGTDALEMLDVPPRSTPRRARQPADAAPV